MNVNKNFISLHGNKNDNKVKSSYYELCSWDFVWSDLLVCQLVVVLQKYYPTALLDYKLFEINSEYSSRKISVFSLNLLDTNNWITIHITPQEDCKYFSIETSIQNLELFQEISSLIQSINHEYREFVENYDDFLQSNEDTEEFNDLLFGEKEIDNFSDDHKFLVRGSNDIS